MRRRAHTPPPHIFGGEPAAPLEDTDGLSDEVHLPHGELIAEFEDVMLSHCGWDGQMWGTDSRPALLAGYVNATMNRTKHREFDTQAYELAELLSYTARLRGTENARSMAGGLLDVEDDALPKILRRLASANRLPLETFEVPGIDQEIIAAFLASLIDPEGDPEEVLWGCRVYAQICYCLDYAEEHALLKTRLPRREEEDGS